MSENSFIYNDVSNNKKVGCGSMLLAQPLNSDEYFAMTSIMILDQSVNGGFLGLILNKCMPFNFGDLFPEKEIVIDIPVFGGGPMEGDRLFILHTLGDLIPGSIKLIDGLYVGGEVDDVINYIEENGFAEDKMRFFLGYCGWEPHQLESEIDNKYWAVGRVTDNKDIFKGWGVKYWRREVEKLGENFRSWLIVPPDPTYN